MTMVPCTPRQDRKAGSIRRQEEPHVGRWTLGRSEPKTEATQVRAERAGNTHKSSAAQAWVGQTMLQMTPARRQSTQVGHCTPVTTLEIATDPQRPGVS